MTSIGAHAYVKLPLERFFCTLHFVTEGAAGGPVSSLKSSAVYGQLAGQDGKLLRLVS